VRIGQIEVDLRKIADSVPRQDQLKLQLPPPFAMPATLGFPRQASLLIQTDREGRDEAIRTVQMVMTRLLTTLPPGRVRFTLFDPVGLGQNFAGFMHLADHDEALVGGRIWTEAEHIDQRLADLTEHMETVIQKYLRNEFETIDDYNAQAGELAEPYRFLVIADFPVSCEGDVYRRLAAIASSGARCGVYTLVMRDLRQSLPSDAHMDELIASSVNLVRENGRFMWKDEVFGQFPLTLDRPPEEEFLTRLLDSVGRFAKEAKRVEVPFETITPKGEEFWSGQATDDLRVPIGKTGATRLQSLRLGRGVAQHSLIAGKTGSGKSTLLHVLITNMALWYSPDEVEFYLVDFKKGVEFKTYATHNLPHARAIAVESDREFGLSVLQRLDAELSRRGAFYRDLGVQDLAAYRAARVQAGDGKYPTLPRTLLIIDEFQEFFTEDDKLAQDAGLLIDRLVRQGRAFGVHVLLGSQTIGGSSGLARSTLGQMAVRVALQCSEADSQMILGDSNGAARLLSRPGEAIYNDAGGLVENNSPFQVAWLPDDSRDVYLDRIVARIAAMPPQQRPRVRGTIVFEGNAPADITKNERLTALLAAARPAATQSPVAYLGEPVAIKEPTSVTFQRQSGANVLLVGQHDEAARAIFTSALISLAAQHKPGDAEFVVLDGTPADQPHADYLARVKAALPQALTLVEYRAVPDAMARIAAEVKRRQEADEHTAPGLYLCIFGLQRYRALRKTEESFSFSASSEEKPSPAADKLLADVLRDGPSLGVHTIVWVDTPASLDRTMDRASMREFDHRVLFQMSATDSSNLIDSPAANKLGFYRALAYSEEQGVVEKFRPYALPGEEFLNHVRQRLGAMER
jgi:adenylate kinase family enzyme